MADKEGETFDEAVEERVINEEYKVYIYLYLLINRYLHVGCCCFPCNRHSNFELGSLRNLLIGCVILTARRGWNFVVTLSTVCPRSSYPICIVPYYIKWVLLLGQKVLLQIRTLYSNIFNISFCKLSWSTTGHW